MKKARPPGDGRRINRLLDRIARMAGGDLRTRAPISPKHDAIDAMAFGLNLLAGELRYTMDRLERSREDAERARAAREIFFRNVTHELRTPITVILLVAETLRGPELGDAKRRRLAERVERSGRSLLRLVDHVLDLSRLEAQRLELLREAVSPEAIAREALEALELEAERKGLRLRLTVARDAPAIVLTDVARCRQIVLNLVGNAVKFTEKGSVEVRIAYDGGRDRVAFDVIDTGVGITKEDRRQLFQPFARGRATAQRFPGNGLGLALSRRLAEAMAGELLLVRSTPGKGSRFRLTLPGPPRESRRGGPAVR